MRPLVQADTPQQATLGPHFILAQARPAAVCRLTKTLGVMRLRPRSTNV